VNLLWTFEYKFWMNTSFHVSGYMCNRAIARSYDENAFPFTRKFKSSFQSGCTILYSHQILCTLSSICYYYFPLSNWKVNNNIFRFNLCFLKWLVILDIYFMSFIFKIFLLLLCWGYSGIYQSSYNISELNSSPLSFLFILFPNSQNSWNKSHFSIFINEYIIFPPYSSPNIFPFIFPNLTGVNL
jgi:hypothetical protein